MIVSARWSAASAARRMTRSSVRTFIATPRRSSGENKIQANDPSPKPAPPSVSETNALETDAVGSRDAPLQEVPEDGEKQRQMQAPNRATKWSPSQQPREKAMSGPRFEQTIMEFQVSGHSHHFYGRLGLISRKPQPYAAIELIHKQPVRWTHSRVVSCDGGGGPLGHPKIFINVDKPQVNCCTYCGLPFVGYILHE
jgi:NADH dehydrogenase (ubiquinone) Fe-S protein 6